MQGTAKTRVLGGPGSFNRWNWQCECGALSQTSFADREEAREALKQHRKTHRKQAASKAAPPPPKTEEPKTVETKVKKPKGEKKERRRRVLVTQEQAKEALARLKAKESTLIAESKRLGFRHNGPLRKALRELMGRDVYAKLMDGRRGRLPRPKPAKAVKKAKAPKPAPPEESTTP